MSDEKDTFKPITRAQIEAELYRDRVDAILKEHLDPKIEMSRIRVALARPHGWPDIQKKWVDMKEAQGRQAKRRGKEVTQAMQMLRDLRGLDTERTDLDEMVALAAFGLSMKTEYDRNAIPIPEWLESRLADLERAVRLLRQDALEKKLKELQSRKEALKTAEQKRHDVDAELSKVMAALGKTPAQPATPTD